jgi:RNA polymerase sigma-70 factor, ECF subfamily
MTAAKAVDLQAASWDSDQTVRAADKELILDLYDRERVSLRRYLMYVGVDPETAAETVQESFLRLHQHLLAGGDRTNLRAWLYRVAHNLARNVQSSSQAKKWTALDEQLPAAEARDRADSAEDVLVARQEEERLHAALLQLSAPQQNCLVLRSQGLKYREIAEALDLSVSTVAEHVQRGLERLRELL